MINLIGEFIVRKKNYYPNFKQKIANDRGTHADTQFLAPTSNIVERLFSQAGLTGTKLRQSMNPMTLEEQILLQN